MMLTMKKSLRRRARSEELDRERSEDLRRGTPAARHAAAVLLGRRGGKNGDADAHRAGGRARVRASREKGGRSRSEAKIADPCSAAGSRLLRELLVALQSTQHRSAGLNDPGFSPQEFDQLTHFRGDRISAFRI